MENFENQIQKRLDKMIEDKVPLLEICPTLEKEFPENIYKLYSKMSSDKDKHTYYIYVTVSIVFRHKEFGTFYVISEEGTFYRTDMLFKSLLISYPLSKPNEESS